MRTSLTIPSRLAIAETDPKKMQGPENNGDEITFEVSEAWWASGKAGELATVLREVGIAYGREIEGLILGESILVRERHSILEEYRVVQTAERAKIQQLAAGYHGGEFDPEAEPPLWLTLYEARELMNDRLQAIWREGNEVDYVRNGLILYRQDVYRWSKAMRALSAAAAAFHETDGL